MMSEASTNRQFLTIRQKNGDWSSLYSGIWNWRIAIIFSLYSWVRTFTFNTWYLFYIYKRNLYSNLISSAADFAKISPVIRVSYKKWISLALFWTRRERPWPVLYWYLMAAYLRSLYLNMGTSGLVFHPISPVIRLPWWKTKFVWPSSQYVG